MSNHKSKRNKCVSRNLFVDDAIITIVLLENYPCTTKNELKARELHHITNNLCINKNKPFISDILWSDKKAYYKEYRTNHKDEAKIYDVDHRDQINANRRARYAKNKLPQNLEHNLNNNITV